MQVHRYFLVNKPFNMVSQFVSSHDVRLLGDLDFNFPEGTHAIGIYDAVGNGNVTYDGGATITARGVVVSTSANPSLS